MYVLKISQPSDYITYHQGQHSEILHGAHLAPMSSVWISTQRVTFVLNNLNRLVFITDVYIVYCTVRTEILRKTEVFHF
jgi:hypothetical protein